MNLYNTSKDFLFKSSIIVILIMFVFFSCRKTDFEPVQTQTDKFFITPASTPELVLKCMKELKRQNSITGFISELVNQQGYAVWDKSYISCESVFNYSNVANTTNDTLVFIPLVPQGGEMVSGFLFFRINGTIEAHLYRANDYDKYSYGPMNDGVLHAEDIAKMLVTLDCQIFGKREYTITDSSLFKMYNLPDSLKMRQKRISTEKIGDATYIAICTLISVHCPYLSRGYQCPTSNIPNECDKCPEVCADWDCNGTWIGGGTGGATINWPPEPPLPVNPDPGPGGGTGTPPPDPNPGGNCTSGNCVITLSQIIEGRLPCGDCGNNPIIILPNPDPDPDPCPNANIAAEKMDVLYQNSSANSVIAALPNINTHPFERGFGIRKTKVTNSTNPTIFTWDSYQCGPVQTDNDPHHVNMNIDLSGYQEAAGFLHIHTNSGYSAQSADDVYELIKNSIIYPFLDGNMVHAYNGDEYAITITDPIVAQVFLNTQNLYFDPVSADWNKNSAIGKAFDLAMEYYGKLYRNNPNKNNLAYEMAMAAVLKEFNTGVTLHKKDLNGHFKPLIIATTTPNPAKPNKKVYLQICL